MWTAGCQLPAAGWLHRLREAEVEYLHRAIRPHLDVGGFEIAMDDPLLVRGFEGFGDLPCDRQRLIDWKPERCSSLSLEP